MRQTEHDSNGVYYFSDPTNVGCFFTISLPPALCRFCLYHLTTRTVNKTSWSNPRQTRICYIFRLWIIVKALLRQISLCLLSHFRIRIIVLTCPDNKSARNPQPKSYMPAKSHKSQWCEASIISISVFPFSLFLFVWRLESTTTKSLLRHFHCRGSPLFKKPSIETLLEMEGQHALIRRFAVGSVYPSKSLTMCSSDFIFRKYKQDSAFRVSGVLVLVKTGPPVTKNFPLLRLFPSDALIAWRFYTPYDVNHTNLHILTAWDRLWSSRKNLYALVRSLNSNYESEYHRLQ